MCESSVDKQTPLDKVIEYFLKHKDRYLTSEGVVYLAEMLKTYYELEIENQSSSEDRS